MHCNVPYLFQISLLDSDGIFEDFSGKKYLFIVHINVISGAILFEKSPYYFIQIYLFEVKLNNFGLTYLFLRFIWSTITYIGTTGSRSAIKPLRPPSHAPNCSHSLKSYFNLIDPCLPKIQVSEKPKYLNMC